MSTDLNEFIVLSRRNQRGVCQVAAALEQLKPADRVKVVAALAADPALIRPGAITEWLKARGVPCPTQSITYHRREACRCHD